MVADISHPRTSDAADRLAVALDGAPTMLGLGAGTPEEERPEPVERTLHGGPADPPRRLEGPAGAGIEEVLLAAWMATVARHAGEPDVVVGCAPRHPRRTGDRGAPPSPLPHGAVLVVRQAITPATTFEDLVVGVGDQLAERAASGPLSVSELADAWGVELRTDRHPFFQVGMAHGEQAVDDEAAAGAVAPPDAVLHWWEDDGAIRIRLVPGPSLGRDRAEAIADHLVTLLAKALAEPHLAVASIDIRTDADVARLAVWNGTDHPHDATRSLAELFAAHVVDHLDAVAVEHDGARLTYRELDERSWRAARTLRARGVGPDVTVAISMGRSIDLVVAVLAVVKAGGAYVPVDPAYPGSRRAHMRAASGARLVVADVTADAPPSGPPDQGADDDVVDDDDGGGAVEVVELDQLVSEGAGAGGGSAVDGRASTGADLGYVIFTSGSTGMPKAVALPQRALTNLVEWQLRRPGFVRGARVLQFSSLSFDVSAQELFTTWCSGGTLVLVDEGTRRDSRALLDHLVRHDVARIFLPFVALRGLADAARTTGRRPTRLREVYTAGEQLQVDDAVRALFLAVPEATLENQYGPSESHVVTAHRLTGPADTWPTLPAIGGPIANTAVHIVGEDDVACPPGVEGELLLSGVCLARGYLGDPERTAERFVDRAALGGRCYRTGDLGRWRDDGTIELLGRADDQVKFRGFRIEPGEVGAVLSNVPGVRQCVATVAQVEGVGARLAAYVVTTAGEEVAPAQLHRHARAHLPDHMVPSHLVFLDELPLTPSGKVDVAALPAPSFDRRILETAHVAPRTEVEAAMRALWERMLGIDDIGVQDDFFDLGGDSLLAIELFAAIKDDFGRELPLGALAQAPTIAGLAAAVAGDESAAWSSLVPLRRGGSLPPLFCVHGGSGNVASFSQLARQLPEGRPVYALQWDGLDGSRGSRSIEAMADTYLDEVRSVQPHGPYVLAGQCVGGLVAREMARQLIRAGDDVDLVVMYDSPNLDSPHFKANERLPPMPRPLRTWVNRLVATAVGGARLLTGRRSAARYLLLRLRLLLGRPIPQRDQTLHGTVAMVNATWRYRIPDVEVATLYLHNAERKVRLGLTGVWTDDLQGWTGQGNDQFNPHHVVADHSTMPYHPDAVRIVSDALTSETTVGVGASSAAPVVAPPSP